jgi:hypothetical protein
MDLSYRAQVRGWRFVYLPEIAAPAELPVEMSAFKAQQFRWAKGSVQVAKKLLPTILRSNATLAQKSEAFFHLTNNAAYLLTMIVALLMVPAIVIRQRLGIGWSLLIDGVLFAASTGSVLLFYVEGQRHARRAPPSWRELAAVLPVGIGISMRNSAAVLEGAVQRGGYFWRTPKRGSATRHMHERQRFPAGELIFALFFLSAAIAFIDARQWVSLPFIGLFLGGYSYVAISYFRTVI